MGSGGSGGGVTPTPEDGWPIGVPVPDFGIEQEATSYTHYVDNTFAGCSDDGPGTEAQPRCSLPSSLAAGSVVEIHGGPYPVSAGDDVFDLDGTEQEPVFLRGVGDPVMDGEGNKGVMVFRGTYFVVEGLHLENGAAARLEAGHHQAFRHNEVDAAPRNCLNMASDHAVAYDNELHHCHDGGKDRLGIHVLAGTTHNWIVGNHIHHNASNGIQYAHGAQQSPPDYVFIGGNVLNGNRERGLDSKWAGRSVVSQNHIYDVRPSQVGVEFCMSDGSYCMVPDSATNGAAVHIGADGYPQEKWVLYNTIHDTNYCVRLEEAIEVVIVGNLCKDVPMAGLNLEKGGPSLVVAHNTFFNVATEGAAVIHQFWSDNFTITMHDNLFVNTGVNAFWFESSALTNDMSFVNNIVYEGGAPFSMRWLNQTTGVSTTAQLEGLMAGDVARFEGNQVIDPMVTIDTSTGRPVSVRGDGSPTTGAADDLLLELDTRLKASFGSDVTLILDKWKTKADIGAP